MPTGIEWTDETWNPIRARNRVALVGEPGWRTGRPGGPMGWHCEHVSPGCAGCYAEGINRRLGTGLAYKPGHRMDVEIFVAEKSLLKPLHWRRPRRIFVCSMTDLFADFVTDEMIDRVFAVMALCPQHTFQVLTKRADRMRAYLADRHARLGAVHDEVIELRHALRDAAARPTPAYVAQNWPLPNVWLGVSVEDQRRADERIPDLLATPAAVRFLSCEPLLGPLDLSYSIYLADHPVPQSSEIDWVICGGESGPKARPMHPDWARSLRDQCAAAGVPFFFKQWGEHVATDELDYGSGTEPIFQPGTGLEGQEVKRRAHLIEWGGQTYARVGKKAAGRLLDGVTHDGMPVANGHAPVPHG